MSRTHCEKCFSSDRNICAMAQCFDNGPDGYNILSYDKICNLECYCSCHYEKEYPGGHEDGGSRYVRWGKDNK